MSSISESWKRSFPTLTLLWGNLPCVWVRFSVDLTVQMSVTIFGPQKEFRRLHPFNFPLTLLLFCLQRLSLRLLQYCSHCVYTSVCTDRHVITFDSDKCFGLDDRPEGAGEECSSGQGSGSLQHRHPQSVVSLFLFCQNRGHAIT